MHGEHSVSGLASFPNSFLLRKKMVTRSTERRNWIPRAISFVVVVVGGNSLSPF